MAWAYSPAHKYISIFLLSEAHVARFALVLCESRSTRLDGEANRQSTTRCNLRGLPRADSLFREARALPVRTLLYWPDEMPPYCYFLTGGIASVVAGLNNGASTEVGLVGNESLVGAFHIIGPIDERMFHSRSPARAIAFHSTRCASASKRRRRSGNVFWSWWAQSLGLSQVDTGCDQPGIPWQLRKEFQILNSCKMI
jgi:hypothetical protein